MFMTLLDVIITVSVVIFSIMAFTFFKIDSANITDTYLKMQMKEVSSLFAFKGNEMTQMKDEYLNAMDGSYETKNFEVPKTLGGYSYYIRFIDRGSYTLVQVYIPDRDLTADSLILKNGCVIQNPDKQTTFEYYSLDYNVYHWKIEKDATGRCVVTLYPGVQTIT